MSGLGVSPKDSFFCALVFSLSYEYLRFSVRPRGFIGGGAWCGDDDVDREGVFPAVLPGESTVIETVE